MPVWVMWSLGKPSLAHGARRLENQCSAGPGGLTWVVDARVASEHGGHLAVHGSWLLLLPVRYPAGPWCSQADVINTHLFLWLIFKLFLRISVQFLYLKATIAILFTSPQNNISLCFYSFILVCSTSTAGSPSYCQGVKRAEIFF